MTRRNPWAVRSAGLLVVLFIFLLTITSLAQTTKPGEAQTTCSEGCHEARDEPRPDWHPDITDRTADAGATEGRPKVAEALTATTLDLSLSSHTTAGEPVALTVALRDASGSPVPKAEVRFLLDAEFAGTQGQMEIGAVRTDLNGAASLDFRPTVAQQKQVITARFEGTGHYGQSEGRVEIASVVTPPPAYSVAPIGLEAVGRWTLAVFMAAILGVWVAFGFVLYQAYAISRGG